MQWAVGKEYANIGQAGCNVPGEARPYPLCHKHNRTRRIEQSLSLKIIDHRRFAYRIKPVRPLRWKHHRQGLARPVLANTQTLDCLSISCIHHQVVAADTLYRNDIAILQLPHRQIDLRVPRRDRNCSYSCSADRRAVTRSACSADRIACSL